MRTLILIRHAKAVDADPRGDHERALADRGRRDAEKLGAWLHTRHFEPDLVLVSTAARTQQTVESLLVGLRGAAGQEASPTSDVEVWSTRRIYDGGVDGVLEAIHEVPDSAGVIWVVGHEPVMSTTAWDLADGSAVPHEVASNLAGGFPTSSAAVLHFQEGASWARVGFGSGQLVGVHTARA